MIINHNRNQFTMPPGRNQRVIEIYGLISSGFECWSGFFIELPRKPICMQNVQFKVKSKNVGKVWVELSDFIRLLQNNSVKLQVYFQLLNFLINHNQVSGANSSVKLLDESSPENFISRMGEFPFDKQTSHLGHEQIDYVLPGFFRNLPVIDWFRMAAFLRRNILFEMRFLCPRNNRAMWGLFAREKKTTLIQVIMRMDGDGIIGRRVMKFSLRKSIRVKASWNKAISFQRYEICAYGLLIW